MVRCRCGSTCMTRSKLAATSFVCAPLFRITIITRSFLSWIPFSLLLTCTSYHHNHQVSMSSSPSSVLATFLSPASSLHSRSLSVSRAGAVGATQCMLQLLEKCQSDAVCCSMLQCVLQCVLQCALQCVLL